MIEELKQLSKSNSGFLKSKDIATRTQWRNLSKMLEDNSAVKIRRGLYLLNDGVLTGQDAEVAHIVPEGVLCLFSAWSHYELTTTIPHSYYVAIEKKRKIILPERPPIILYYWQQNQYELGISSYTSHGVEVRIYDMEKSVCDAVKFRNKVGMDITIEVVRNYVGRGDRNFDQLTKYARQMRIETTMQNMIMPML